MRQGMLSEIGLFAGHFAPEGWMFCDGQRLQSLGEIRLWPSAPLSFGWAACDGSAVAIRSNTALFSVLGTTFGGDDSTQAPGASFNLPRMAPLIPGVSHVICVNGTYPRRP